MLLKIMSPENAADDDSRKTFRLYGGVKSVEFERESAEELGLANAFAHIVYDDDRMSESIIVNGNAYVMNDAGKTVASFAAGLLGEPR